MIHRPSARAFLRDICQAAGCLVVVAALADYAIEAKHLRARVAELEAECDALADVANDLAHQLARAVKHPCVAGTSRDAKPITTDEMVDAMAVLDTDDCGPSDLIWLWGDVK